MGPKANEWCRWHKTELVARQIPLGGFLGLPVSGTVTVNELFAGRELYHEELNEIAMYVGRAE